MDEEVIMSWAYWGLAAAIVIGVFLPRIRKK